MDEITKTNPELSKPVVGEIDMGELKNIINLAVKDATASQIKTLKEEMSIVNRKSIFPNGATSNPMGEMSTDSGSIVDFGFLGKAIKTGKDIYNDFKALKCAVNTFGGPFKSLSREMELFAKYLRMIVTKQVTLAQGEMNTYNDAVKLQHKQAGMNEGVPGEGGVLVPVEYMNTIIEFAIQQSPLLSQVWRIPMTRQLLRIPRLQQAAGSYFGGMQLYSPGEGRLTTSTMPTLEQLTLTAKKRIGLIYLTDELVSDSAINLVNYLTILFSRFFQYDMEGLIINNPASATIPCLGITETPGINVVPRTTAGHVTIEDILAMDASIDENFRDLTWLTRKATQIELQGLRDNQNRPIFLSDYGVFQTNPLSPNSMVSYPVFKTRNIPPLGETGDLILAVLSYYLLGIRQDLTIDMSEYARFEYDDLAVKLVMRYDGQVAIPSAFSVLDEHES